MKYFLTIVLLFSSFLFAESKYCNNLSDKRHTLIYIDLSNTNNKAFSTKLIKNLKGSFLPHERVKVFFINPQTSEVQEVLNTCVPKLSKEEINTIKKKGGLYLFGGNPIDEANENLMIFYSRLNTVFKKAIKEYVETESKPLVEIFYNEEDKFSNPLNRVIIYSDMVQNSDDIPLDKVLKGNTKIINDYKVNYNYSNIYVLLNKKALKGSEFLKLKRFWNCYYESNYANMKNFNTTLDLPKYKNYFVKKYEGNIVYTDKSEFKIKILIAFDGKGHVVNGWFIINGIDAVPVKGKVFMKHNKLTKVKLSVSPTICKEHYLVKGEKININFKNNIGKGELIIDNAKTIVTTPKGNVLKNPKVFIDVREMQ